MHFSGEFETSCLPGRVFDLLHDREQFARLFPDFQRVQLSDSSGLTVSLAIALGSLRSTLELTLERSEQFDPVEVKYAGNSNAAGSQIKMDVAFTIAPENAGSKVHWQCSADVQSSIPFLGPQMMENLGRTQLEKLIANLEQRLAAEADVSGSPH